MSTIGLLAPFVMLVVSSVIQIKTDPRITNTFIRESLLAMGVFAVHGLIGFGVMIFLGFYLANPDQRQAMAGYVVAAWMGWLGLGGLGLIRHAPRTTEPPK